MTKNKIQIRPASSAIATALALVAAPSLAQETATGEPVVIAELPEATSTISQPQIIVPDAIPTGTATVTPDLAVPVVLPADTAEETPATTSSAATAATTASATRTVATTAARPAVIAPADPSPVANADFAEETGAAAVPVIEDGEGLEGAAALAATDTATARPATSGLESSQSNADLAMAGGALALGFGFVGLFMAGASRRRRRARPGVAEVRHEPVVTPVRDAADGRVADNRPAAAATAATPVFALSHSVGKDPYVSKWDDPAYVTASPTVGVAGRSVPNTPQGRKALIDRLVRARPDRTNPFRSPSARRRRARLIVQSLKQKLTEQPNLDFRRFYDSFGRRRPAKA
ncbi:hypothetical protein [Croceicoccus bisphenolivorans]|uniref:hypothetical protein n=1 Tax=Croceicoccus bisphenolivorans TaxID=1783232 RepID=UPI00082CC46A|nr:hypothetical protein [Croceicoccus bisphenolivorans]